MGARPLLLQTVVRGQPIVRRFLLEPKSFSRLLALLVGWLRKWNEATAVIGPLAWGRLDAEILAPAASLVPHLEHGRPYYEWLVTRCASAAGVRAPLVATHNDLTMSNVLVDEQGRLGIVDWEAGRLQGLPLVDFFYAVTDAALATHQTRERVGMVEACFTRDGEYASIVTPMLGQFIRTLAIPAPVADLCFHACWLWHACNEQEQRLPGDPRPFLKIVQWLALREAPTVGGSAG